MLHQGAIGDSHSVPRLLVPPDGVFYHQAVQVHPAKGQKEDAKGGSGPPHQGNFPKLEEEHQAKDHRQQHHKPGCRDPEPGDPAEVDVQSHLAKGQGDKQQRLAAEKAIENPCRHGGPLGGGVQQEPDAPKDQKIDHRYPAELEEALPCELGVVVGGQRPAAGEGDELRRPDDKKQGVDEAKDREEGIGRRRGQDPALFCRLVQLFRGDAAGIPLVLVAIEQPVEVEGGGDGKKGGGGKDVLQADDLGKLLQQLPKARRHGGKLLADEPQHRKGAEEGHRADEQILPQAGFGGGARQHRPKAPEVLEGDDKKVVQQVGQEALT